MNKLLLSVLLLLSPLTTLPAKNIKKYKIPTRQHMIQKQRIKRQEARRILQKEDKKRIHNHTTTLCTPKVIETGGAIIITTLQVVAIILSLVMH